MRDMSGQYLFIYRVFTKYLYLSLLYCVAIISAHPTPTIANGALGATIATSDASSSFGGYSKGENQETTTEQETLLSKYESSQNLALIERNELLEQRIVTLMMLQDDNGVQTRDSDSNVTFAIWISILLGCVAVIVTTLGVGLAVFSFFGYRETMRRSAEIAKDTAAETAIQEIVRRMENGDFKHVIEEAVDRVAFRSFQADMEDTDEK